MSNLPAPPDGDDAENDKNAGRGKWIRGALNAASGAIPFAGGFLAAAAGVWGENEQQQAMDALRAWIKMLEDELREKQRTILEIMARLDMHDQKIAERVMSSEYQSLLKKAFRNWAGTESGKKQEYIRNVLTNAASVRLVDDDVISLFVEWLQKYSELHFAVIGELYRSPGSTRGQIWRNLGKSSVREDSAEADLFRLLIRDLSTGGIIRQHRETDYAGNFIAKQGRKTSRATSVNASKQMKSAFDDEERYELTALGEQFVHYAMNEVTVKITYSPAGGDDETSQAA
ncbi:hypothetical protein [Pseudorhodoplanes sp.]|uniref:hypothetical protein n=1 Tax=Pseudorhodoplanes sp. TaxID=1934341 RepID=UPI003D0A6185